MLDFIKNLHNENGKRLQQRGIVVSIHPSPVLQHESHLFSVGWVKQNWTFEAPTGLNRSQIEVEQQLLRLAKDLFPWGKLSPKGAVLEVGYHPAQNYRTRRSLQSDDILSLAPFFLPGTVLNGGHDNEDGNPVHDDTPKQEASTSNSSATPKHEEKLTNPAVYAVPVEEDNSPSPGGCSCGVEQLWERGKKENADVTQEEMEALKKILQENPCNKDPKCINLPRLHNYEGMTPLIQASRHNKPHLVEAMLSGGAKLEDADSGGLSAFHWAAIKGNVDVIRVLAKSRGRAIDEASKKKDANKHNQLTSLQWAVQNGHDKAVVALIECRASLNIQEEAGQRTALHIAVENRRKKAVKTLVDACADVQLPDKNGVIPIDLPQATAFKDLLQQYSIPELKRYKIEQVVIPWSKSFPNSQLKFPFRVALAVDTEAKPEPSKVVLKALPMAAQNREELCGEGLKEFPNIAMHFHRKYDIVKSKVTVNVLERGEIDLQEFVDHSKTALQAETGLQVAHALDLCSLLERLHTSRWVHTDIQPNNFVLHYDERRWKLIDLDQAACLSLAGSLQRDRALEFVVDPSPQYSAPEILEHSRAESGPLPATRAMDLYSLGLVLYFLATGRHLLPQNGIRKHEDLVATIKSDVKVEVMQFAILELVNPSPARRNLQKAIQHLEPQAQNFEHERLRELRHSFSRIIL
eukprot:gb/GEZN01001984.1/.p1 GENE.gb/GEZN01001984.1/~~gb/GEZN01001984.1/.p1  ORF type:complete len:763 (+),score=178.33 gb/GEZN01001984.1/:214-2289(+)